jgi:hypothetical protein
MVTVAEERAGRIELWGGWSLELPNACVVERSPQGPWAAWDDKHSVDVHILEVAGHQSGRPMTAEEMLGSAANTSGDGWIGFLETLQEDDAGRAVARYALKAAAQNTWISCWVSFMEPDEPAWAEQVARGLRHLEKPRRFGFRKR